MVHRSYHKRLFNFLINTWFLVRFSITRHGHRNIHYTTCHWHYKLREKTCLVALQVGGSLTFRPVDLPVFYLPQVRRLDRHYELFGVLEQLFEVLATSSNFLLFWVILGQNISLEKISSTKESTISRKQSIYANFFRALRQDCLLKGFKDWVLGRGTMGSHTRGI